VPADVPAPVASRPTAAANGAPLPQLVDNFERELVQRALLDADYNVALAADNLAIPRKTLYDKLKKYQIGTGRPPAQG